MKNNSRSRFKIKSLNQEKVFNKIVKNFVVYNVKEKNGITEFEVSYRDGEKLEKYLQKQNVAVLAVRHFQLRFKKFLKMWGIFVGLVLGLSLYLLQYNFIFKIEVWGCENIDDVEIETFIKNHLNSNFKPDIDTVTLEKLIKNNFEKVSSVSVAIIGQSLVVNINEAVLPDEMEGNFEPLISQYDGIVKQINLVQGTINIKEGDIVKKGDILVFPYIYDSDGQMLPVQPKAEIIADIWIQSQDVFYEYFVKEERTGRKKVCSQVSLFGLTIYSNTSENNFETYQCETESSFLTQNNILPFIYTKYIFYETKTIEIIRNFEEEKDEVIKKLRENSLISLDENEIIIDENCSISGGGGIYYLSYTVTVEKDIGEGYGYQFPQS